MPKSRLTDAEKQARQHQRKADRVNAKAKEEIGPLFADQAPQITATDAYWHWRRMVAIGVEDRGVGGTTASEYLNLLRFQTIRRLAEQLVPEHFAALDAHCMRVYPSTDYWFGFWSEVLVGRKTVTYSWKFVPDPRVTMGWRKGERMVPDGTFPPEGWTPPITYEALAERFTPPPYLEPSDDGGAWDRLQRLIQGEEKP